MKDGQQEWSKPRLPDHHLENYIVGTVVSLKLKNTRAHAREPDPMNLKTAVLGKPANLPWIVFWQRPIATGPLTFPGLWVRMDKWRRSR